jgi:hypothetical protein
MPLERNPYRPKYGCSWEEICVQNSEVKLLIAAKKLYVKNENRHNNFPVNTKFEVSLL